MNTVSDVSFERVPRRLRGVAAVAGLLALGAGPALATQIFHPSPNTCVADNCNAVKVGGTVNAVVGGRAGPWTIEVFAVKNQCLRLAISQSAPTQNLEIAAVTPSGRVYRNSAGAASLVKFVAQVTGWHSVSISQEGGSAIEKDFDLLYGVYKNAGNPNCTGPTPPL